MRFIRPEDLNSFPPVWCRILAVRYTQNKKWQWPVAMTDEEIAERSGLSLADVKWIGMLPTWDDVPCGKMIRFVAGCGIKFDNWKTFQRTRRLAARGKFEHLRRSPLWESQFSGLVSIWESANGRTEGH